MGTIGMRVEAMVNDSKSKSPRTLYEYALQYHEFSEILWVIILLRNTLLEGLTDGAVGYVNQSLRNIICCAKCNCHKVQSKG